MVPTRRTAVVPELECAISNVAGVEIRSGDVTLSGQSSYGGATTVSGGSLTLDGANRIADASALVLAGGLLNLNGDQAFASLSLEDSSAIDFGDGALTFTGLGTIAAGKTLALYDVLGGGDYLLRFLGDVVNDAGFQDLMRMTEPVAPLLVFFFPLWGPTALRLALQSPHHTHRFFQRSRSRCPQ